MSEPLLLVPEQIREEPKKVRVNIILSKNTFFLTNIFLSI